MLEGKTYKCSEGGEAFSQSMYLARPHRTHAGDKPHEYKWMWNMAHPLLNIREFIPHRDLMDVMNLFNFREFVVDKKPCESGKCGIL